MLPNVQLQISQRQPPNDLHHKMRPRQQSPTPSPWREVQPCPTSTPRGVGSRRGSTETASTANRRSHSNTRRACRWPGSARLPIRDGNLLPDDDLPSLASPPVVLLIAFRMSTRRPQVRRACHQRTTALAGRSRTNILRQPPSTFGPAARPSCRESANRWGATWPRSPIGRNAFSRHHRDSDTVPDGMSDRRRCLNGDPARYP